MENSHICRVKFTQFRLNNSSILHFLSNLFILMLMLLFSMGLFLLCMFVTSILDHYCIFCMQFGIRSDSAGAIIIVFRFLLLLSMIMMMMSVAVDVCMCVCLYHISEIHASVASVAESAARPIR